MNIEFLGTGAADWKTPNADGEYRRNTSTLIGGRLLIDANATLRDKISRVRGADALIYTHSHSDHFDPAFAYEIAPKAIYAERSWAADANADNLDIGVEARIAGFSVTPLPANHSTGRANEKPLAFIIDGDGARILYSTDGAWLTNRAYIELKKGAPLDALIIDATVGDDYEHDWRSFEHNTLAMARYVAVTLKNMGLLKHDAPVFATHIARALHPRQSELEEREREKGGILTICRDGLSINVGR